MNNNNETYLQAVDRGNFLFRQTVHYCSNLEAAQPYPVFALTACVRMSVFMIHSQNGISSVCAFHTQAHSAPAQLQFRCVPTHMPV